MKRTYLLILISSTVLASCSDKEKEAKLNSRIIELEKELDDCQNGADKLLAKMKIAFESEYYGKVKSVFTDFKNRHPESVEFKEAKSIYEDVIQIEENNRKEAERLLKEEKAKKLKALSKLRKNYDDVSGITWYKQPYFTHYTNTNLTSIYMGDNDGHRWLRLMMSYNGDDWIFFEKAYLSYDGKTFEVKFDKYQDKKTESGGGVWEWIDLTVDKKLETFLREFAKSKNAKMRLSGKYTKTRKLTYNERRGILDVLSGYDALNGE